MISRRDVLKSLVAAGVFPFDSILKADSSESWIDSVKIRARNLDWEAVYKQKEKLVCKWKAVLDKSDFDLATQFEIAPLLENIKKYYDKDTDTASHTLIGNIHILFSMLKFNTLEDLISWQTLLAPAGLVFFMQDDDTANAVAAETHKSRCIYNLGAVKDLKAFHGIDPYEELMTILAYEVKHEISRMVVNDLMNSAATVPNEGLWRILDQQHDEFQKLGYNLPVFRSMHDDSGYWLLTSPEIFLGEAKGGIKDHKGYEGQDDTFVPSLSIQYKGTLRRKVGNVKNIRIYTDPLFPLNRTLIGAKFGPQKAGYIFAPYQLPIFAPVTIGDNDFVPSRAILSRYAKKAHKDSNTWYKKVYGEILKV